jgi:hypothetical protein
MPAQCPSCLSRNCRRSRLRWYDWARMMLLQQPLRCHTCFHRFYRSILGSSSKSGDSSGIVGVAAKKPL